MNIYFKLNENFLYKKILLVCLTSFFVLFFFLNIKCGEEPILNGVFTINSKLNESLYFSAEKNTLLLETEKRQFEIIQNSFLNYNLKSKRLDKFIGIDKIQKNQIKIYDFNNKEDRQFLNWNIKNIGKDEYIIQNNYNRKYLKVNNDFLTFENINCLNNKNIDKSYKFRILKLYETISIISKEDLYYIEKEPIDIFIKYIDISDKSLKRNGIKQIFKDQDNEELRYSLRSIFENIPWVRKIFIVMPNEKVKFLKPYEEIKEKIVYVKDKDLLGYDTANPVAFQFNLYKMEKFGISKNFIYMDDDYFFGEPLNKSDFFYYDKKEKKIVPYLLTTFFREINKTNCINSRNELLKRRSEFKPQDHNEFVLSMLNTENYLFEKYNLTLINTHFTHNAIAENIDDLRDIFNSIQDYEYIKETLFSKTRHPLRLNAIHYYNLFQLNINHRKVHYIPNKYIEMENVNLEKLHVPLFVINTCGNNIPTKENYKNQRKVMSKRFPNPTKYEIKDNLTNNKINE